MLEVLIGLAMSIITQIVKKTGVDGKIVILALSITIGTIWYIFKSYLPEVSEQIYLTVLWAYGFSQIVYNYVIEFREKKK